MKKVAYKQIMVFIGLSRFLGMRTNSIFTGCLQLNLYLKMKEKLKFNY